MIIDGKKIAQEWQQNLKAELDSLKATPGLAIILVGSNPASLLYVNKKQKTAAELGIKCQIFDFAEDVEQADLLNTIQKLNNDSQINGIVVQLPLPKALNESVILNSILPQKDVDGFSPCSKFVPATALGVLDLIKRTHNNLNGLNAVVIGRSKIVGAPVAKLLLQANCTVSICHSHTKNLTDFTKLADIIVIACGQAKLLKKDMVKTDCIIIDVGINTFDGKICGDSDFENLKDYVANITPVPGGVGPMTVAMLMHNTILAYRQQNHD